MSRRGRPNTDVTDSTGSLNEAPTNVDPAVTSETFGSSLVFNYKCSLSLCSRYLRYPEPTSEGCSGTLSLKFSFSPDTISSIATPPVNLLQVIVSGALHSPLPPCTSLATDQSALPACGGGLPGMGPRASASPVSVPVHRWVLGTLRPPVSLKITPADESRLRTVRAHGRVVLYDPAGLEGHYVVRVSRFATTTLTFETDGPLPRGDVVVTYTPERTTKSTLEVTVDA